MRVPDFYEYYLKPKVISGKKALDHIAFELGGMNAKKPIVITSKKHIRAGLHKKIIASFKDSGLTIGAIYDGVPGYLDPDLAYRLIHLFRWHNCDSIIALGGKSVAEYAKALNIFSANNGKIDIFTKDMDIKVPLYPLITVPTMDSDGYESTNSVSTGGRRFKSESLYPDLIVIDSRTTSTGTTQDAIASSLIALAHSVEAYISNNSNPMMKSFAHASIQYVFENIVKVAQNPRDKKGGIALVNAAVLAGSVFSNSSSHATHILGTILSKKTGNHAAIIMGAILPCVMELLMLKGEFDGEDFLLAAGGFDMMAATPVESHGIKSVEIVRTLTEKLHAATQNLSAFNISDYIFQETASEAASSPDVHFTEAECLLVLKNTYNGTKIKKLPAAEEIITREKVSAKGGRKCV